MPELISGASDGGPAEAGFLQPDAGSHGDAGPPEDTGPVGPGPDEDAGSKDPPVPPKTPDGGSDAGEDEDAAPPSEPDGGDKPPLMCLVDQDGDGFGAMAACPHAGQQPGLQPGDCGDDNGRVYPDAAIDRCDGVDTNCDGNDDDEQPLAESCNGGDDDCDGLVDQGLLTLSGSRVVTRAGTYFNESDAQLVRRNDGGAWLLSLPTMYGKPAETIDVHGLDPTGAWSSLPEHHKSLPDAIKRFAVSSDGTWVALLSMRRPRANDLVLRLTLLRAEDMQITSEIDLLTRKDDDGLANDTDDADDCHVVLPLDVAVTTDASGQVRVATAFYEGIGYMGGGPSCSVNSTSNFQVATFTAQGTEPVLHTRDGLTALSHIQVAKVPCRPEWLVVDGTKMRRFSESGVLLDEEVDVIIDSFWSWALESEPARCDAQHSNIALVYTRAETMGSSPTLVRNFRVNHATGALGRRGNDVKLTTDLSVGASLHETGGRWFVAGWFGTPSASARLWEVATSDDLVPAREILLPNQGSAYPGRADSGASGGGRSAVVATRDRIVVAWQNGNGGNLASHREPEDTNAAITLLQSLACP